MNTTQTIEPLRPIYGPADERWAPLQAWFDEHADELLDDDGKPRATMGDLWPGERARWYEWKVLGLAFEPADLRERGIEYPDFPADASAPAWATGHDDGALDDDENPVRLWHRDVATRLDVPIAINQLSTFDVAAGKVIDAPAELSVWVDGDTRVQFATVERAKAVAAAILLAADEFAELATRPLKRDTEATARLADLDG